MTLHDQSGIVDFRGLDGNGGVTYSVATLDISALTNSDPDLEDLEQMISGSMRPSAR